MNVARKIYLMDTAYDNRWNKISEHPGGVDIIPLISVKKRETRKAPEISAEDLNDKLTYFYNNGGPIVEL